MLDTASGVLLSGGGNLTSTWPHLLHLRILLLREARRRHLPVVTGGQTLGPDLDGADRAALAGALGGVAHLGVRELPSAALAHVGMAESALSVHDVDDGRLGDALRGLWAGRDAVRAAMRRARTAIEADEAHRWDGLLRGLGWLPATGYGSETRRAVGDGDRTASAALAALALERAAADEDARRARATVAWLERSVDLAGRTLRAWGPTRVDRDHAPAAAGASLTGDQWASYDRDGYVHLGELVGPDWLDALRRRADDLASGAVRNPTVLLQLDTGGAYDELPEAVGALEPGTVLFRKIQGLETDELFGPLVRHPLILDACARAYGPHCPVSTFRAMVMNKPAGQGTLLPWHQDGGDVWALDRDPLVTVWVALDPATTANGCHEVIPGSHRLGLLSSYGSTLAPDDVVRHCRPERIRALEVDAGHGLLVHNWLVHRSGVNPTDRPRRAFTACYMDGRTLSTLTGARFPLVAGSVPDEPYPFVRQLVDDAAALRAGFAEVEAYAVSLRAELALLREQRAGAEEYARSLEREVGKVHAALAERQRG